MLAVKNRLTESRDYKKVEKEGIVHQSQNFGLAILDRHDDNPSRFGFVVSTKISKDSVDRNRFKRTMSEAVRTSMVDIKNGVDVVFLAKQSMVRFPTSEIMKEVKVALKTNGLMKQ